VKALPRADGSLKESRLKASPASRRFVKAKRTLNVWRSPASAVSLPAAAGSSAPRLSAGSDGRVYLSWVEPGSATKHALRFSVLEGDAWSAPREVAAGDDWFVNWADFPSVVEVGGRALMAHWLEKNGAGTFAYSVNLRRSADGGRTWATPVVPHRDGTETEHGFVSLVPWEDGRVAAAWLDGRNFAKCEGERSRPCRDPRDVDGFRRDAHAAAERWPHHQAG